MGDSGNYFLCNLGEKILIARAIDNIPMSFRTRYVRTRHLLLVLLMKMLYHLMYYTALHCAACCTLLLKNAYINTTIPSHILNTTLQNYCAALFLRYIFCMAPVTADNKVLLAQFQDFASAFSKFGRVPLTNSVYLR